MSLSSLASNTTISLAYSKILRKDMKLKTNQLIAHFNVCFCFLQSVLCACSVSLSASYLVSLHSVSVHPPPPLMGGGVFLAGSARCIRH